MILQGSLLPWQRATAVNLLACHDREFLSPKSFAPFFFNHSFKFRIGPFLGIIQE